MHEDSGPTGRGGRLPLVIVAITVLMLLVLRSPADVLGALTPGAPRSSATDDATAGAMLGSVPAAAVASGDRNGESDGGPTSEDVGDVTSDRGRWGVPAPRPTTGVVVEELRGPWRIEPGIEEAVALAVVAAHRWATEAVAGAEARGGGGVIVTVEAVERPGAHHAVVTLLIAVPDGLHRIAQPVRLDTHSPALAGPPWRLPAPELRVIAIEGIAIGDAELVAAAERALTRAGLAGERLSSLEATDGWPFIARLDDTDDVWLRWHVDRFVVPGLPLDTRGGG